MIRSGRMKKGKVMKKKGSGRDSMGMKKAAMAKGGLVGKMLRGEA